MKLLIGGDPEIFLKDTNTDKFVSATEFNIPGTKKAPHKVARGAVQIDGTALEINLDPAETPEEFSLNLKTVLGEAQGFLPKHVQMVFIPSINYDKKYYASLPNDCKELGCDPDYRGITGERNAPPAPLGTLRTASGHITLGWGGGFYPLDANHFYDCRMMSVRLDEYFQQFRHFWDLDEQRQYLYGAGAAFRPKPFGVEYRALSNAWVGRPELWHWIFRSTKWVFDHALSGKELKEYAPLVHKKGKPIGYDDQFRYVFEDPPPMPDRIKAVSTTIKVLFQDDSFPEFPSDFVPAVDDRKIEHPLRSW